MSIGVSYFGNRILRHVEADMDDLVTRGFTGVLHTFSENDYHWYHQQMARIVETSKRRGLEVQVRTALKQWATAAVELGADRGFWDEPHWAHPVRFDQPADAWTCICDVCQDDFIGRYGQRMSGRLTPEVTHFRKQVLTEMLGELLQHVADLGGRSTVCLLPRVDGLHAVDSWNDIAALPGLDLSPAQGPEIRGAVAAARKIGVTDLWTWGYEACGHMSHLATEQPGAVWEILTDAMTSPADRGI